MAGTWLARDLINTPANDMGPAELEAAARAVAEQGGGELAGHHGCGADDAAIPLVAAVGQGSPPRAAPDRPALPPARCADA
ncbi:MAG: hypothetical protein V9G12_20430 [Microthrixaceae bacterium]